MCCATKAASRLSSRKKGLPFARGPFRTARRTLCEGSRAAIARSGRSRRRHARRQRPSRRPRSPRSAKCWRRCFHRSVGCHAEDSRTASCRSHSEVALALLTLAMVVLHATSGILDFFRARLLGEAALRLDRALSARVFAYHLNPGCADDQSLRDLDQMRAFLSGPAPAVVFDVPWLPVYLGAISLLHPLLGVFATGAAGLMLGLTLAAERGRGAHAARTARGRWSFASSSRGAAAVAPMALESGLHQRWTTLNRRHLQAQSLAARHASALSAAVKAVRPALNLGSSGPEPFSSSTAKWPQGRYLRRRSSSHARSHRWRWRLRIGAASPWCADAMPG